MRLAIVLLLASAATCQTRKPIDWTACTKFTDQYQKAVGKFNTEHQDGFEVMLSCTYHGDPKRKRQPEQHVSLTVAEIEHLHELRAVEDAGYGAMHEYEDYLFRAHHIHKPETSEPCYHYVGIVVDTDYITVDPNPMMAGDCE